MIASLISNACYIIPFFASHSNVSLRNKQKTTNQPVSSDGFKCQPMALYCSGSCSISWLENKERIVRVGGVTKSDVLIITAGVLNILRTIRWQL